jgi:archaemetzincin
MKNIIELLKIGDLEQSILVKLKDNLENIFNNVNLSINIIRDEIKLDKADYNPERGQYNADKILKRIIKHTRNFDTFRVLGVMDEDIYSEPLNFVFGIAIKPIIRISGAPVVALISITRLNEQFYRRSEDNIIFELRILKEAVHELGHTFKLSHCNKLCIMRFSNSLMDTDKKPSQFCESCSEKLRNFFKKLDDSC